MIPLYEFRMLMTEKDITFVHLDLYRSSMGLCSMQSLMMSGSCQIFPKAYYDGHKGSEIARKAVSFHHDLVMYDFHTTHQDFFDLLFDLKLYEKNLHSTYPIGAMMANLLKKRLSFYRAI